MMLEWWQLFEEAGHVLRGATSGDKTRPETIGGLGGPEPRRIEAFAVLAGVEAVHVASGGVGGSEGAVVLSLEGAGERLERAFELVKSIRGEPPVTVPDTLYVSSAADYNYDAAAQLATLKGM